MTTNGNNIYIENKVKTVNDIIKHVSTSRGKGISNKKLDLDSLCITVFSDAPFGGDDDSSSQVGFMIFVIVKYVI